MLFLCGWRYPERGERSSRVTIAEPCRAGVPLRSVALRTMVTSPPTGAFIVRCWANGSGDASRVTIAEPYRAGVPLRSIALRTTDASPLRVPLSCVFGQTILSCDNRPTGWCLRAAAGRSEEHTSELQS